MILQPGHGFRWLVFIDFLILIGYTLCTNKVVFQLVSLGFSFGFVDEKQPFPNTSRTSLDAFLGKESNCIWIINNTIQLQIQYNLKKNSRFNTPK